MKKYEYKKGYQNNAFNAKISSLLDRNRTIMDVDCFLFKLGCDTKIIYDHKRPSDKTTISSLRGYSMLADKNTFCYIVLNDVDENGNIKDNITRIYEIKPQSEVKDKSNKQDYIKHFYILVNDVELANFFKVEKHKEYKETIKKYNTLF